MSPNPKDQERIPTIRGCGPFTMSEIDEYMTLVRSNNFIECDLEQLVDLLAESNTRPMSVYLTMLINKL